MSGSTNEFDQSNPLDKQLKQHPFTTSKTRYGKICAQKLATQMSDRTTLSLWEKASGSAKNRNSSVLCRLQVQVYLYFCLWQYFFFCLFVTTMISTTISTQYYTLDISPREIVSFVSLRLLIFPGILFNHCYAGSGDHYSANHYRLQNKGNRKSPTT